MIAEALKFLQSQSNRAELPTIITSDKEPKDVYYIRHIDGKMERVEAIPPRRNHVANDIPSLVHALTTCDRGGSKSKSAIFFNVDEVVGVFDDSKRSDRVTISLGTSPFIDSLRGLEAAKGGFDQKALIRFLRHDMSGCLGPSGGLIDTIRSVKFTINESGESTRTQGKASIGNRLEAELTGVNQLPEYVQFAVPVFANPAVQDSQMITCTLDVDEIKKLFYLTPVPMAIDEAISAAEKNIGDRIVSYIGSSGLKVENFVIVNGSVSE